MGVGLEYKTRTLALLEEEYDSNYQIVKHLHAQIPGFWEQTSPETTFMPPVTRGNEEESL